MVGWCQRGCKIIGLYRENAQVWNNWRLRWISLDEKESESETGQPRFEAVTSKGVFIVIKLMLLWRFGGTSITKYDLRTKKVFRLWSVTVELVAALCSWPISDNEAVLHTSDVFSVLPSIHLWYFILLCVFFLCLIVNLCVCLYAAYGCHKTINVCIYCT